MALVPSNGPGEVELYRPGGLTRSQERHAIARYREQKLNQRLSADYYAEEENNQNRHTRLIVNNLTDLDDDIQSKINASASPRREDALEKVYAVAEYLSLRRLRRAYGDG